MAEDRFSLTPPPRTSLPQSQIMAPVPPGCLSVIVTYLEMTAPPAHAPLPRPAGDVALVRANPPTASYYRYLYDTVGEP